MSVLHYIWVGPPARDKYIGSDTIGPDLSRLKNKEEDIHFWCLNEQVDYYQVAFKETNITVHAIEPMLAKRHQAFFMFFERLRDIAKKQSDPRNESRDFTTLKAATQYFLQTFNEGFFLDCNIIPDETAASTTDKELSEFSVSYLDDSYGASIDPWLMYSPKEDHEAMKRFEYYFQEALGELNTRTKLDKIDRNRVAKAFVTAPTLCKHQQILGDVYGADCIKILKFQKRYNNSHKLSLPIRSLKNTILVRILSGSSFSKQEFLYYLNKSSMSSAELFDVFGSWIIKKCSLLELAAKQNKDTEVLLALINHIKSPKELFDKSRCIAKDNLFELLYEKGDVAVRLKLTQVALSMNFKDEAAFLSEMNKMLSKIRLTSFIGQNQIGPFASLSKLMARCDKNSHPFFLKVLHAVLNKKDEAVLNEQFQLMRIAQMFWEGDDIAQEMAELIEVLPKKNIIWRKAEDSIGYLPKLIKESVLISNPNRKDSLICLLKAYAREVFGSEQTFLKAVSSIFDLENQGEGEDFTPDLSTIETLGEMLVHSSHALKVSLLAVINNGQNAESAYTIRWAIAMSDETLLEKALEGAANPHVPLESDHTDKKERLAFEFLLANGNQALLSAFFKAEVARCYVNETHFLNQLNGLIKIVSGDLYKASSDKKTAQYFETFEALILALAFINNREDSPDLIDTINSMFKLGPVNELNKASYQQSLLNASESEGGCWAGFFDVPSQSDKLALSKTLGMIASDESYKTRVPLPLSSS
jgi:hypothetical protein